VTLPDEITVHNRRRGRLCAAAALFTLAHCAGAGSSDRSADSSLPLPAQRPTSTLLYVTDRALQAVVAFDTSGRKVAEYDFNDVVFDVVTDSHGNVYVMYAAHGTDKVKELSHDLSTVIATYSTGALGFNLAIDVDDNLYVEHLADAGEDIYEYRYGSTTPRKVYAVADAGLGMTGISVRDGFIYTPVKVYQVEHEFFSCQVNAPTSCAFEYVVTAADCGFTTTVHNGAFVWYGSPYFIQKIALSEYRKRGRVELPSGFQPGWAGFCSLHNYGHFAWLPITPSSGTGSARVIELDLHRGDIVANVGAGVLSEPVAAFYGNGFTP
jgi:hypothetical protein